ncbi:ankyrin repeat domain-containing protein [Actinomadura montaniterrae]|uniref:Ankyrin repeat domain-containing protein n=1 Tax=Actinomadura montaniterrae TaxID=1803903 RepID=A0A6L3VK11_9ACTN|nr:ankyrin repeat domain-containing protein [Actinomadura montaniterrae]KAB2359072.1 ankyrin repeat domain-containing protein [Actinomadura montaniterrae]
MASGAPVVPPAELSPWARAWLHGWRRTRRHRVPRWMIERSARHRRAGDWRGACAAAHTDVAFTLDGVARDHGSAVARRLSEDLRHLVPDLLRWHLPRGPGDLSVFDEHLRFVLARYGDGGPVLQVFGPPSLRAPQRLRLVIAASADRRAHDWTGGRRLFDDRHCGELIDDCGGAGRIPFFHADGTPLAAEELPTCDPGPGDALARAEWSIIRYERGDTAGAFSAAGFDLRPPPDPDGRDRFMDTVRSYLDRPPTLAGRLGRLVAERGGGPVTVVLGSPYVPVRAVAVEAGGGRARPLVRPAAGGEFRSAAAPDHWRLRPDTHLLLAGMITPDELHPLIRSALFPARPAAGPVGPPDPGPPESVRVRCGGEWHEVRWSGGALLAPHSADEERRELALRALGGEVSGCFAVREAWRTGRGRLPRELRRQRSEVFLRALHGDTPGVLRLLDAGMDPHARDGEGRTLLHFLYAMDHRLVLPRLLAAGLDVDARDRSDRTPLAAAVTEHGSFAVVRALLEAGASRETAAGRSGARGAFARLIRQHGRTDLEPLLGES